MRLDRGRLRPYVPSFPEKRQFLPLFYVNQRGRTSDAAPTVACLQPFSSLQAILYSIVKERRCCPPYGHGTSPKKKLGGCTGKSFRLGAVMVGGVSLNVKPVCRIAVSLSS